MNKKLLILYCLIYIGISFLSCAIDPIAGGSDMPNGNVEIAVLDENANPVTGKSASLTGIIITETGDSIVITRSAVSDSNGMCTFRNVPNGKYVIYSYDSANATGAVLSKVEKITDDLFLDDALVLKPVLDVKGRMLLKAGMDYSSAIVVVPGLNKRSSVDSEGFYSFNGIPQGQYDISFIYERIVNYLPVTIENPLNDDSAFIEDAAYATLVSEASNIYSFYSHKLDKAFSIVPKKYEAGQHPSWYEGKDFSLVTYFDIVADTLKPVWKFPVIVGVTARTAQYYGGLNAIKVLIADHIESINEIFGNAVDLKGTIAYSIDSVYQISGTVDDENVEPPKGMAFRLIYDGYDEGTFGNWVKATRVICHNSSPETGDGMFGNDALLSVLWEFGLSRGCTSLYKLQVDADKNPINHEAYVGPTCIMNSTSTSVWSRYSVNIMNYYANRFSIEPRIIYYAFPKKIGILITNSSGSPFAGVTVNLYGVQYSTNTVEEPAVLSGTTDSNGELLFNENPFKQGNPDDIIYPNFLVSVVNGQDTTYAWFPFTDAGNAWFANPDTVFYKHITF